VLDHGNHNHDSQHAAVDELELRRPPKRKGFLAPHKWVSYDVYGQPGLRDRQGMPVTQSPVGNPALFTGRELDNESSLYHYRARTYDASTGRLLQRDPLGYISSLSQHEYADSSPAANTDPTGLSPETERLEAAWAEARGMVSALRGYAEAMSALFKGLQDQADAARQAADDARRAADEAKAKADAAWEAFWSFLFDVMDGHNGYCPSDFDQAQDLWDAALAADNAAQDAADHAADLEAWADHLDRLASDAFQSLQQAQRDLAASMRLAGEARRALLTEQRNNHGELRVPGDPPPGDSAQDDGAEHIPSGREVLIDRINEINKMPGKLEKIGEIIDQVSIGLAVVSMGESAAVGALRAKFPAKMGKIELHHITPKYLGGDPSGPTIPIDGAYHQLITNAFRSAWSYGRTRPSSNQLRDIMKMVYDMFPLPGK
jgi:RHS repeat-associated protein